MSVTADNSNENGLTIEPELRPINCELNPLTRSDGSALFTQGSTCVLAALLGPVEVKSQFSKFDKSYIECNYRPKFGFPTVNDKIKESLIKESIELAILSSYHPRALISAAIQELDDRGGLEACAVNAACMALLITGVPMKFTFAAVHCVINQENEIILDPDTTEMECPLASFTFVFDSLEKDIMGMQTTGHFKQKQLNEAIKLCRAASDVIFKFYRKILTNFHNKSLLTAEALQQKLKTDSN